MLFPNPPSPPIPFQLYYKESNEFVLSKIFSWPILCLIFFLLQVDFFIKSLNEIFTPPFNETVFY